MHTHTTPNGHDFPSGEISAGFLQEKRRTTPNSSDVISHWFPFAAPPVVSPARFTTHPTKRWYCFQHWQYTDFHWFQKHPQMPRSNVNPDTAMRGKQSSSCPKPSPGYSLMHCTSLLLVFFPHQAVTAASIGETLSSCFLDKTTVFIAPELISHS